MKNISKNFIKLGVIFSLLPACSQANINYASNIPPASFKVYKQYSNINPVDAIKSANSEFLKRNRDIIVNKYNLMSETLNGFYRSTAYIFYSDVATDKNLQTNISVPLHGDLHLDNLSTYHTSNGQTAYDLYDFDDSFTGPYTWDLARCALSIYLSADDAGIDKDKREKLVTKFLEHYLKYMQEIKTNPSILKQPLTANLTTSKYALKAIEKTNSQSYSDYLNELVTGGKFQLGEKILPATQEIKNEVKKAVASYSAKRKEGSSFFNVKDIGIRIAGVGSLGFYRYIVLAEGKTPQNNDDIILDVKEARPSSGSAAISLPGGNQAERVMKAYMYFLPSPDPYIGTTKLYNSDFCIRQLLPSEKAKLDKIDNYDDFKNHIETVAIIVARGHARSGKVNEIIAAMSKSGINDSISEFTSKYFDQFKDYYNSFRQALKNGQML